MTDIYKADPTFGGAFAMDAATLSFGSNGENPGGFNVLTQSVNASYSRPVQRIYELGPEKATYYVAGRSEGQMNISRLAAPAVISDEFFDRFGDICQVDNNNFRITSDAGLQDCTNSPGSNPLIANASKGVYHFKYCLITNLSLQIAVQALAMTENVTMTFARMERGK